MDEASKLVSELQHKLAELDQKVSQYRRDMASEFDKYAESLLRDVPKDVAETVSRAIAESWTDYKSLYPTGPRSIESCTTGTSNRANGSEQSLPSQAGGLPIPTSFQRQELDKPDSPRSPHDREKEFQGLFTPSYLPLLDSTSRNERRPMGYEPPIDPVPVDITGTQREIDDPNTAPSTAASSLGPLPDLQRPPTPKRKNTDEVSVGSDWSSDGPVRRSALRRSSSSSKSPRRVRFEEDGHEVPPTSSPRPKSTIPETDMTSISLSDFNDDVLPDQINDADERPPKRISSSQKLRELSRSPMVDDGTLWETVSAPPDGSASVATNGLGSSPNSSSEDLHMGNGTSKQGLGRSPLDGLKDGSSPSNASGSKSEQLDAENQAETPSDDEMLDMPPLIRQTPSPSSMLSPVASPYMDMPEYIDSKALEEDHDEMFLFDDDQERRSHPTIHEKDEEKEEEEEEEEEEEAESPMKSTPGSVLTTQPTPILSSYSRSPARDIVKLSPRATPPVSSGILGSYKGHPFSLPIVSPEIHAQAASLGAVNSFVGSIHGHTGFDESDIQSFRASGGIGSFSGTPMSFSERMRIEDLEDGRRKKSSGGSGVSGTAARP